MVLKRQPRGRRGLVLFLLLLAAACAQATPTPIAMIVTTTPVPHTPVPTFERLATATPTAVPTEPLVILDSLTGTADSLYVRDKPSTMGTITRTVSASDHLNFTGRSDDSRWVEVTFDDQSKGWMLARALMLPMDISSLPVTATAENVDFVALVSPQAANGIPLYASPHSTADVVATLAALTPLRLDGRRSDGIWVHGQTADSKEGWVERSLVDLNFDIGLLTVMAVEGLDNGTEIVQATVLDSGGGLRLRQLPSTDATRMSNLNAGTDLTIEGRTADNGWLLVKSADGYEGWAASNYIELYIDLSDVPVINNPQPVKYNAPTPPPNAPNVVSNVGGGARQIYLNGQAAGNQRNVFAEVGDSLTDTPNFLRALGGSYNLRDYGYLLPMIQYFSGGNALGGDPFVSGSISSHASWSTVTALDPATVAGNGQCQSGETSIACEMRVVKPAVVIIMIGTNDAPAFPPDVYGAHLKQIIDTCIQYNVVPILSTLPPRAQFNDNIVAYNQVITSMAQSYGVPLTDLYSAVVNLPNHGYGDDGIHLSVPPGGPPATVDFTAANLQFGSTVRNLTVLQILDTVWKQVLY